MVPLTYIIGLSPGADGGGSPSAERAGLVVVLLAAVLLAGMTVVAAIMAGRNTDDHPLHMVSSKRGRDLLHMVCTTYGMSRLTSDNQITGLRG